MNRTIRISLALTACVAMSACSTVSKLKNGDEVTDFKASADANAAMYEAQADVMGMAHEAIGECNKKAASDLQFAFCTMQAQVVNLSQALSGKPQPNRNPMSGTEANAEGAKAAIGAATTLGTAGIAAGVAKTVINGSNAVKAKDPVVVTQPAPIIVEVPTQPAPILVEAPTPFTP